MLQHTFYISSKYIHIEKIQKNTKYSYVYKQLFLEDGFKNKCYVTIGKNKYMPRYPKLYNMTMRHSQARQNANHDVSNNIYPFIQPFHAFRQAWDCALSC